MWFVIHISAGNKSGLIHSGKLGCLKLLKFLQPSKVLVVESEYLLFLAIAEIINLTHYEDSSLKVIRGAQR